MTTVDAHVHVASTDTERYPLAPTGVGSDWWRHRADVDALLTAMDGAGVERAVVVQAVGAYGYDCTYAIDAVASAPGRLALVGAVDFDAPDPAAGLVGAAVRVFGVAGGMTTPVPAWLADGRADAVWAACHASGRGVVATLLEAHLPTLVPLLERWPEVPVALDHCAFATAEALAPLAAHPAVHLKVSTHVLRHVDDPTRLVRHLADDFGARRLCWGSDFPQTADDYQAMVDLGRRAAAALDDGERGAFLAGTALRLWFAT